MKMMKLWMLVAVAALASACSKQDTEGFEGATAAKTIEFVATDAGGRTIFGEPDGNNYPVLWQEGDKVKTNLNFEYDTEDTKSLFVGGGSVAVTPSADQKSATFSIDLSGVTQEAPYTFYVCQNTNAWKHTYDEPDGKFRMQVPIAQTATATSCDPAAQILFAKSETMDALPSKINLYFKHLTAYGKISLKNIEGTIKTVILTFEKKVAQNFWYNAVTGEISEGAQSAITITTSSSDVWFAALPADLSGTKLKLDVTTVEGASFSKAITLKDGCELKSGNIAAFSVNFADIEEATAFAINEVYKENDTPVGIVFWVSDDGQTAKIVNLQRTPSYIKWSNNQDSDGLPTTKADGMANTQVLYTKYASSLSSVPMLEYLNTLNAAGDTWYWPSSDELKLVGAAYEGMVGETWTTIQNGRATPNSLGEERRNAQIAFDKLLIDNGGVAMNPLADGPAGGDASDDDLTKGGGYYWASNENSTGNKGVLIRFGSAYADQQNKDTSSTSYYGRAIKVVTK